MSTDLSDLARRTAEDLNERKGVTGVVVIVLGESDAGSALSAADGALDTLIATTVQMLGLLRNDTINGGVAETEERKR